MSGSISILLWCSVQASAQIYLSYLNRSDDLSQLTECLQLVYHQTVRDQLLLLYAREILVLDLTINQTVGIVAIDRAMSPFTQVTDSLIDQPNGLENYCTVFKILVQWTTIKHDCTKEVVIVRKEKKNLDFLKYEMSVVQYCRNYFLCLVLVYSRG